MASSAVVEETTRTEVSRWLLPVLIFATLVMSVVATLGTPMVPTISREQGVSLSDAQWMLTITLLVGAVMTPVLGRIADGPFRKHVILTSLIVVMVGSALAGSTSWFPLFLVGRAMQGVGYGLVPMAIAVSRDSLPKDRVGPAVAILSMTTAAGTGIGYPLTGLIAQNLDYHDAFWFAAMLSVFAVVLAWRHIPSYGHLDASHLDVIGAVLFALALVGLLLGISQGRVWGWTSPRILACFGVFLVVGGIWVWHELRTTAPLVQLRLAVRASVMAANLTSLLMGIGLFGVSSLVNRYIQTPPEAGYGFHLDLVHTGFVLMPLSVGSVLSTWLVRWIMRRSGPERVLIVGSAITAADALFLAFVRHSIWLVLPSVGVLGLGISTTFAAMPALIIRAVPPGETGSATGLNAVLRSVGGAVGSAASIAVLSWSIPEGGVLPTDHGYTVAFLASAIAASAAGLAAMAMSGRHEPVRRAHRVHVDDPLH